MNIKNLAKKLRQAADVLDELFHEPSKENGKTAEKIIKKYTAMNKGYKYKPGTHWTQKPENKARLIKMLKKVNK